SVKNAKIIVKNIYKALAEFDNKNEEYYKNNADKYLNELEKLDLEISEIMKKTKNKKFIIYHPAYGYFANDYGLEQISIEYEGKEPSLKWVEEVIKEAKENNIKIVLVSKYFPVKTAEVIAKEINGTVKFVDPLSENYIESMRNFSKNFEI
ncbi:MAG: metal ABC transporter solute-binding protein, Zn/Mn family, partial [Candidatus Altarchaeaceae archaeon]